MPGAQENPYDTAHSRGVSIALMAFRDRVHAAAASHSQLLKRILARAQQPMYEYHTSRHTNLR